MKRLSITLSIAIALSQSLLAQNEVDALRYAQTTYGGTARYVGMGGAFGALGADASTLSTNPAGLGLYRKSELTFTPTLYNGSTSATYNGSTNKDNKYNFNFGNWGFILNVPKGKDDTKAEWKSISFGIGYNRQNNFNNRFLIDGKTTEKSLLDQYVANANGTNPNNLDQFKEDLAYQTYLIDTIPHDATHTQSNQYFSNINHGKISQTKSRETSGGMGETFFSFGANYNNKLYLGATIGYSKIKYNETTVYTEKDNDTAKTGNPAYYSLDLNNFRVDENLSTTGKGFNVKVGAIYSVTDWLRIGGAVHTPTFYSLTDVYSDSVTAAYTNWKTKTYSSPSGLFDYSLTTPFKAIGSLGFIINKIGVISADYEYVNYSQARLSADKGGFKDANKAIQSKYTSASNIRLGTEWRFEPFSIRAGYSLYGSPYQKGINDGARSTYSFGIGYKQEVFYIDVAYQLTQSKEKYYMYDPSYVNATENKIQSSAVLTTIGFKF